MRAGVVGRGRGDRPGEGGLCKLDGSALWGLFPRGSVGASSHACAAGGVLELPTVEFRQEVVQPMLHCCTEGVGIGCCVLFVGLVLLCTVGCHSLCQVGGATPLAAARSSGHSDIAALLSSRGALL